MLDLDNTDSCESNLEEVVINIDDFKKSISNVTSIKLCDIVITYKYIGFNKDLAILCMEELSNRRQNGDIFDFESYIDTEYSKLPELNFSVTDFSAAIKQIGESFLK
jgi:hypothetical protein